MVNELDGLLKLTDDVKRERQQYSVIGSMKPPYRALRCAMERLGGRRGVAAVTAVGLLGRPSLRQSCLSVFDVAIDLCAEETLSALPMGNLHPLG